MRVSIGHAGAEPDLVGWAEAMVEAFAVPVERAMEYTRLYSEGDVLVARADDGRVVAGLGLCAAAQRWGGRDVPFDGVAAVCTSAEARGAGVATALMTAALAEMRARGKAVSALYPASVPLYRKVGYELAGVASRMRLRMAELGVSSAGRARPVVRAVGAGELPMALIDGDAPSGNLTARGAFFERRRYPAKDGPRVFVVDGDRGEVAGALVVHRTPADRGRHDLDLRLVWGRDARAMADVVELVRNHGSLARYATWSGSPTDALVMALPSEVWEVERASPWMLRVVDLAAAVAARGFAEGLAGTYDLGVEDATCPWNHGRWRVEIADGRGHAERVAEGPEGAALRLDARGLARLWAGHLADGAARASVVAGAAGLGAAFGGPTPWLQEGF